MSKRLEKRKSVAKELADKVVKKRGAPVKRNPYTARTFKIDDELLRELKELAESENMTVTEILHAALWKYVNTKRT